MFQLAALFAVIFASAETLKCNIVATGNLSYADTSQPQECGLGSLTCVKIVDFSRGTYTKQCQTMNCTLNGVQNAAANCQNTTLLGSMSCCCYGDGCNSTPTVSIFSVIALTGFFGLRIIS